MSTEERRALEAEFDALTARLGAVVPADRKAGVVSCCEELRRMTALVHRPRSPAVEPANVYSLKPTGSIRS
ncbi:MAG TPA: hypothetical protein VK456_11110 [Xanthobacteraceae bacterium]|nr:hypothetical protein [Xanthobacteraceae bacterium]